MSRPSMSSRPLTSFSVDRFSLRNVDQTNSRGRIWRSGPPYAFPLEFVSTPCSLAPCATSFIVCDREAVRVARWISPCGQQMRPTKLSIKAMTYCTVRSSCLYIATDARLKTEMFAANSRKERKTLVISSTFHLLTSIPHHNFYVI